MAFFTTHLVGLGVVYLGELLTNAAAAVMAELDETGTGELGPAISAKTPHQPHVGEELLSAVGGL